MDPKEAIARGLQRYAHGGQFDDYPIEHDGCDGFGSFMEAVAVVITRLSEAGYVIVSSPKAEMAS